jgi:acylpyruvate hydrolase
MILHQHVWAVGRNYSDHAKEMNAALPKQPLFFLKGGGSISLETRIELPTWTQNIHHELELAYLISKKNDHYDLSHITLALDLTARDVQTAAKKNGEPWTLAKSFKHSCPVGPWIQLNSVKTNYFFQFSVNKTIRQKGCVEEMIFDPLTLLRFAEKHFPVQAGDVLLTGTPSGVNALNKGDKLVAQLWESKPETPAQRPLLACHWDVV